MVPEICPDEMFPVIRDAVMAQASKLNAAAEAADLVATFGDALDTDNGMYAADGGLVWTKNDTMAVLAPYFESIVRQELDYSREEVIVLSASSALYVAEGSYRGYDADGQLVAESPQAITMVFVLDGGNWRVAHLHQSFPDSSLQQE